MRKYTLSIYDNNKIKIQRQVYKEGWFIEVENDRFNLYKVPLQGGEKRFIEYYDSLLLAIKEGEKLA